MPWAVPPLTIRMAPAWDGAAPVAEDVAALDRVGVQHRRGDPKRVAVAQPQVGADPGAEREVGVRRAQPASSAGERWLTRPCGSEARRRPRRSSAGASRPGGRRASGGAPQPSSARECPREVSAAALQLAALCRDAASGEPLEHEARVGVASSRLGQVLEPADGVDDPAAQPRAARDERRRGAPGGEDQQVAVGSGWRPRPAPRRCRPRACRRRLPSPAWSWSQVGAGRVAMEKPYPLPFATGTRPGWTVGDPQQAAPPAVPVDGQRQAHRRPRPAERSAHSKGVCLIRASSCRG